MFFKRITFDSKNIISDTGISLLDVSCRGPVYNTPNTPRAHVYVVREDLPTREVA